MPSCYCSVVGRVFDFLSVKAKDRSVFAELDEFVVPNCQQKIGIVRRRTGVVKSRFATIHGQVAATAVGQQPQLFGHDRNIVVHGVHLTNDGAIIQVPHRPHRVRIAALLEAFVPRGHYQTRNIRMKARLRPDLVEPVLECNPRGWRRRVTPRAHKRVHERSAAVGRRPNQRLAVRGHDQSFALQSQTGNVVTAVDIEPTSGSQPSVGERRYGQIILENERHLGRGGVTWPPCVNPLAVDADVTAANMDIDRTVTPLEAARRRHGLLVNGVSLAVAVDPDFNGDGISVEFEIVDRAVSK